MCLASKLPSATSTISDINNLNHQQPQRLLPQIRHAYAAADASRASALGWRGLESHENQVPLTAAATVAPAMMTMIIIVLLVCLSHAPTPLPSTRVAAERHGISWEACALHW